MMHRERLLRRFTILDGMILVAATALALAASQAAWPEFRRQERKVEVAAIWLASGTWTVLLLRFRPPRQNFRRLARGPGDAACLAASVAIIMTGLMYFVATVKAQFTGGSNVSLDEFPLIASVAAAPAILGSWLVLILGRRWRRAADWLEHLGRIVAVGWILLSLAVGALL
jgi:hypothetical protein